ncbi:MAG: hypothetical protein EOO11_04025 [Chitinophagaceae bacterium]|nr:MAG: hypothetical protein EOO11_04025 [Chitinophagaceae bacterium]
MKKIFPALLLAAAVAALPARACDVCGYGPSNYNPFLFPHLARSYVSLSWSARSYRLLDHDGSWAQAKNNTLLLSAQYRLNSRLQLLAQLPFQLNEAHTQEGSTRSSGAGDATVLAQYRFVEAKRGNWRHTVLAAAGAKLPTGRYRSEAEKTAGQTFQPGSGSLDYLANAAYRVGYRNWLLGTSVAYKYNTAARDGFRYGDMLTAGAQLVFRLEGTRGALMPYAQATHETQFNDASGHVLQARTGGTALYVGGGLDASTRSITAGMSYQWAADQAIAGGNIQARPRLQAHVAFSF